MKDELKKDQQLSKKFYGFIAPKIIGSEVYLAKKILALQMFTSFRSGEKLHMALIGDPSSGKSEILQDVTKIMPNSKYTSSHITKVGLLELFNKCDRGIIGIDEFDNQEATIRDALLEAMENQEVTIIKHRTYRTKKARANIVAAMNPIYKEWEGGYVSFDQFPYHNNITLWTRFHIFVPFYEVPEEWYSDIAKVHVREENPYERRKKLRKIIIKRRRELPKIKVSEKLASNIGDYISMLKSSSRFEKIISPRVIDGAISMCRAKARMDKHKVVREEDWAYVKNILEKIYVSEVRMNKRELRRML